MKNLKKILFLLMIIHISMSRIYEEFQKRPTKSRKGKLNTQLSLADFHPTRKLKQKSIENRKLISPTDFLLGSAGSSVLLNGVATQESKTKLEQLKKKLELQRFLVSRKTEQKKQVLSEIGIHVNELQIKCDDLEKSIKGRVYEYNMYIQSKLNSFGLANKFRFSLH